MDLKKLPKWAQRHIYKLERDLAFSEKKRVETIADYGDTKVVLPYFLPDMGTQSLPTDQAVQFLVPNPRRPTDMGYIEAKLSKVGDRDAVEIHGSQPLLIEMKSSNTFDIKLRDW